MVDLKNSGIVNGNVGISFNKVNIPYNAMSEIKRVAAYARVSTDKDDQANSFESQVKYFTEFIDKYENWQLVKVYSDDGISGTSTKNRVGFNSMIDDVMSGKIDFIITKEVSRFARNTVDSLQVTRDLKEIGVSVYFMLDNIGNITTTKKMSDTMTSSGRSISVHTVESYIESLLESFTFYKTSRYDVKGKQYLKTGDKYYVADPGLRYTLLGRKQGDRGHILENVVYLELLRRGYDVYIGKVDDLEVDFVAINSKGIEYYQVSETVRDESTLNRELKSLQSVKDNFPKYILTMDIDPDTTYDGIIKRNVLDWLLDK